MAFQVTCPVCGPREVYEFRFGGEVQRRPAPGSDPMTWANYRYLRNNVAGVQREWWYHRTGCKRWFQGLRDTVANREIVTGVAGTVPDPAEHSANG